LSAFPTDVAADLSIRSVQDGKVEVAPVVAGGADVIASPFERLGLGCDK
jgi:hypothetical protein